MRIMLISNDRARRNRVRPWLADALRARLEPGDLLRRTTDVSQLHEALDEAMAEHVEVLGINGGDGTAHQTLTALLALWPHDRLPRIVLLRGGTMNTLSNGLGGRGGPLDVLDAVLKARARGGAGMPTVQRRPMMVQEGGRVQAGMIFGTGIVPHFLREYYASGDVTPANAAWVLGRSIASTAVGGATYQRLVARVEHRLTVDGQPWKEGMFVGLLAGTQAQLGLGSKPFRACEEDLDRMALIAIDGRLGDVIRGLPRIWQGLDPGIEGYTARTAGRVEIESPGAGVYVVDGELYPWDRRLDVTLGPLLTWWVPRPAGWW
jgi:diacylglycerol kinase family enzyme